MAEATPAAPFLLTPGVAVVAEPAFSAAGLEKSEGEWPSDVNKVPIPVFDTGVFVTELINEDILPKKFDTTLTDEEHSAFQDNPETLLEKAKQQAECRADQFVEGTYRGTQLALTKIYDLIEKKYVIRASPND